MAPKKVDNFNMRVSPDFIAKIDEWRRHQPDIPPRAEAIRRLVERGILLKPLVDQLWALMQEGIGQGLVTEKVFDNVLANAGIDLESLEEHD